MEAHGVVFSPINVFPVKINGEMTSGEFTIKGNISSQFITGLLFALPLLNGNSIINVIPPVESRPYIDMTLNTLKKFGITVTEKGNSFFIPGGQKYASPGTVESEGDWSNSAFFLTAGAVSGKVTVTGLDVSSVQGKRATTVRRYNGVLRQAVLSAAITTTVWLWLSLFCPLFQAAILFCVGQKR